MCGIVVFLCQHNNCFPIQTIWGRGYQHVFYSLVAKQSFHFFYLYLYSSCVYRIVLAANDAELPFIVYLGNIIGFENGGTYGRGIDSQTTIIGKRYIDTMHRSVPQRSLFAAYSAEGYV